MFENPVCVSRGGKVLVRKKAPFEWDFQRRRAGIELHAMPVGTSVKAHGSWPREAPIIRGKVLERGGARRPACLDGQQ